MSANNPLTSEITRSEEEHRSVNGVEAKATAVYGFDGTNLIPLKVAADGALVNTATLTVGDIEIGQVELKDSSSSTQARILTTDPAAADGGVVVRNIPSGTQPVSLATNTPTLQSGSTTAVTQATGTNLHTVVDSGVITTVSAVTAITNALPTGANVIGALTANQSVNAAQINGVTPLMGNGATGTGSQRVTLASDNSPVAGLAVGATASTVPANATLIGGTGSSNNLKSAQMTGNVGDASATDAHMVVASYLFNGTNWDRPRGNNNANTGDTGAKTATGNGATQTNFNARGANILFNVGAVSGTTPTLVFKLQGSSDSGTTFYDIPGAATASITATGTALLSVYPGVTVAANAAVSYPLPRTWRVVWTIGGTTPSFTITNIQVGYIL